MIPAKAYMAAGALVVAFGAGWLANGWRFEAKLSDLRSQYAADVATAARTALNAQRRLDDERDALATRLAVIDTTETDKLKKARNETDRLQRCIDNGSCGLRVRVIGPACSGGLQGPTPAGGVDSGAGAALAPDARQDYFALRAGINSTEAKLSACQASLDQVTRPLVKP